MAFTNACNYTSAKVKDQVNLINLKDLKPRLYVKLPVH